MERLGSRVRRLIGTLLTLAVVLAILLVRESLQPLRDFDTFLEENEGIRRVLLALMIATSTAGALLLALSQFLPSPRLPQGMSAEEAKALSPPMKHSEASGSKGRRWGRASGDEASFASIKEAWRRRSWRYDRRWLVLFSMLLGAAFTTFGLFGLLIVIGSPGVKFLMGGVLAYAVARTVWAMWRA